MIRSYAPTSAHRGFHPSRCIPFQVPQKNNNGTSFYWPRAKGLGGASGTNFYVFTQPPASDIDAIEKLGI
ncbi:hypothetical protein F5148DRAFT_1234738, partial [Russula earlei]